MNRATHERDILSGRCGQGKWPKSQQVHSRNSEKIVAACAKDNVLQVFHLKSTARKILWCIVMNFDLKWCPLGVISRTRSYVSFYSIIITFTVALLAILAADLALVTKFNCIHNR